MSKASENFDYWRTRPNAALWSNDKGDLTFYGRNGVGYCHGLVMLYGSKAEGRVTLQPITSKGDIARCRIDVDIDALRAMLARIDAESSDD